MVHLSAGAGSQTFVLKNIPLSDSPRVVVVNRFLSVFSPWTTCAVEAAKASCGGFADVTLFSIHSSLQNRIAWTLEATTAPETDGGI